MELKTKYVIAALPVVLILLTASVTTNAFAWGGYGPYGGSYGWHHYWGWHHFGCGWGGNGCGSPCAYSYCGSPSPCDYNSCNSGCGPCGQTWGGGCGPGDDSCGGLGYPGPNSSYNQEQSQSSTQSASISVYGNNYGDISLGQSNDQGQSALAGLPHLIGQGLCSLGLSCAYAQSPYTQQGYGDSPVGYGYGGEQP